MFTPHYDPFIGICEITDQYKNESLHKTDCRNVLSDFLLEVHSTIKQPFPADAAAAAGLWTEPQTAGAGPAHIFFYQRLEKN